MLARPCPKPEPQMWDLGPELRDKWEIPRSEVQLLRKLGQGNFGEVYYGKWRNNIEVRSYSVHYFFLSSVFLCPTPEMVARPGF